MEERLVEQRQHGSGREGEPLRVVVQQRHGAPEGVCLLLVALPHVVAVEPRRDGRVQRAAPLGAVDGDLPRPAWGGHRVGHLHLGLGRERVQPGLLCRDVGGRAVRVGVDPQGEPAPVVGVEPEGRVVGVQHQREVAHTEAERVGGGERDPAQHLDLALLVQGGVRRLHPSYGMAMRLPHGTWPSPITPESLANGTGLARRGARRRTLHVLARGPPERGQDAPPCSTTTAPPSTRCCRRPGTCAPGCTSTVAARSPCVQGTVVFSHAGDDRLHRLDPGATEPVAVTPAGPWRFGGMVAHGAHVYAVREDHSAEPEPANELVRLDLHGDNADGGVVLRDGQSTSCRGPRSPPTAASSRGSPGGCRTCPGTPPRCCAPS